MRKVLVTSLTAALFFSAVSTAFAQTNVTLDDKTSVQGNGQGEDSTGGTTTTTDESTDDDASETNAGTSSDTTTQTDDGTSDSSTDEPADNLNVEEAIQSKEQLAELRQKLKEAPKVTESVQTTYEELIDSLKDASDYPQAIEVQKELLERTYQPGSHEQFENLGELFTKVGDTGIKTFINGEEQELLDSSFIEEGRAMVTDRIINSALKAEVKWDAASGLVTITRGNKTVILDLEKKTAETNGEAVTIDAIPVIKNDLLFLPIRFISEQLDAEVNWQPEGQIIIIDDKQGDESQQPTDQSDSNTSTDANTSTDTNPSTDTNTSTETNTTDSDTSADTDSTTDTDTSADTDSTTDTETSEDTDSTTDTETSEDTDSTTHTDSSVDTDSTTDTETSEDTDSTTDTETSEDTDATTDTETSADTDSTTDADTSEDTDSTTNTDTSNDTDSSDKTSETSGS